MKNVYFEDYEELVYDIANKYDIIKDGYNDICIIAKYEEAIQIVKELLCFGYDICSLEIHPEDCKGYADEYAITLCDGEVWCEPMLLDDSYITVDSPIIYVLDNCSSKVVPHCRGMVLFFEVTVGEDNCDSCDNCDCQHQCEELLIDEDTHGFNISSSDEDKTWSYSFYSTDTGLVKEMLNKFK